MPRRNPYRKVKPKPKNPPAPMKPKKSKRQDSQ